MSENVRPIHSVGEVYIDRKECASRLSIGLTTLDKYVREGMPSHSWGLRVRRFRMSEVEAWLRKRERGKVAA